MCSQKTTRETLGQDHDPARLEIDSKSGFNGSYESSHHNYTPRFFEIIMNTVL